MTLEQGERLLVTFLIPLLGLVVFSEINVLPTGTEHPVDFLAPSVLSLAVLSTAMVSLGIATAFERSYGVIKRLGTTPLGRPVIVTAKIVSVLVVELVQVLVLGAVAYGLGWHLHGSVASAVGAELLATVAFGGLGLLIAGTMRAELTLAVVNGLYVVLLLIGGILFPVAKLGVAAPVARLLPAAGLSDALHATLGSGTAVPTEAWVVLVVWALLAPALAAWRFRFT